MLVVTVHPRVPRVPLRPTGVVRTEGDTRRGVRDFNQASWYEYSRRPPQGTARPDEGIFSYERDWILINLQAWTLGKELSTVHGCACCRTFYSSRHAHVCVCVCVLVSWGSSHLGAHSAMKYPTHALRMPSRLAAPGQASASCSSSAFCSSETHLDGVTVGFG